MLTRDYLDATFMYSDGKLFWRPKPSVTWLKTNKKWAAQISVGGKNTYIGSYETKEAAECAYIEKYHAVFGHGRRAGTTNGGGYRQVRIEGKIYPEHRIIFMMHHGNMPEYIDHINGVRTDNRIENLRKCTPTQNSYNSVGKSKSGLPKGITWSKRANKYQAQLSINGKNVYLGLFTSLDEAEAVVKEARLKHHGEFSNNMNGL